MTSAVSNRLLDRSLRSGPIGVSSRAFGAPASSLRSRGGGLFARALIAFVVTTLADFRGEGHLL